MKKIILASGSPRRAKILKSLGVKFKIVKSGADEVCYPHDPERTVRENALAKGQGWKNALSADTIVWYHGKIYGKPRDLSEAKQFLRELSGKTHTVFTGVAFNGEVRVVRSGVRFRRLNSRQIEEYVARVRPTDRAGAYDIDESGDLIVRNFTGSYENIMGLPVEPLREWGIVPPLLPRVVVTAGPTREFIDPVRFISNPSTGKMGFAVAEAAAKDGCETTLIAGPVEQRTPKGVKRIDVVSARDMLAAALASCAGERRTVFISTAAVADWRPAVCASQKLKKRQMDGVLRLVRNPDILLQLSKTLRSTENHRLTLIGFAAETNDIAREAQRKCREKGLEFIVANDVTETGCGFGTDTNRATIYRIDGTALALPMMTKKALAKRIVQEMLARLAPQK